MKFKGRTHDCRSSKTWSAWEPRCGGVGRHAIGTIVNFNESVTAILLQDNIWTGNTVASVYISIRNPGSIPSL